MEEKISLGTSIRIERIKKGLSCKALADKLEISRTFLSEIERDRKTPGPKTLAKLDTEFPSIHVFEKYKETLQ